MTLRNMGVIVLLLILGASLSIQVMGADEATFDLKKDDETFRKLVKEMAWHGEKPYPYGNWYGPGWWGGGSASDSPGTRAPVDELDSIAMRHDFAYEIAEEQGKIHGPAEEQRLKALADAIAVQDSKKLPADPRDWDPPAPDPAKADRYRRRIGFGFEYLSAGRSIGAVAGKTYTAIKDMVNGSKPTGTSSDLSRDDIDRMARERSQKWFETTKITETYRIELTASQSVIAEGETIPITVKILPVSSTASSENIDTFSLFTEISLDADGPGSLSSSLVGIGSIVNLTATDPWFGSNVGKTINVTGTSQSVHFEPSASDGSEGGLTNEDVEDGQNYVRSVQILEGSIDLQVAVKTVLSLTASPDKISEWPKEGSDPCSELLLRAMLTTEKGQGVESILVTFTLPDGSEQQSETDAQGVAAMTTTVCESVLGGEASRDFTYRASTAKTTSADGLIYFPASNSVSVRVERRGVLSVRGRVVDSKHNDAPISGASVTVELEGKSKATTSGGDGGFVVEFEPPEDATGTIQATVSATAKGFVEAAASAVAGGGIVTVRMEPVATVITCIVLDAESGERLDGSIIRMTQPFATTVEANNGQATIQGLYVGDTVTLSAGGFNHKTYQKTGKITAPDVTITFNLPVGEGEMAGGDLDPTEVDPEDLPILHSLTIWATPANPGPGQQVMVTAQIFPPEPGIPIKLEIVGTDGYSSSVMSMTNAMGQAYLIIPGGGSGVVDRVTVLIIGENVRKRLNYSF
ncbi:carboxypeptidase-like regulatory domain-containing protein [Candidatus Bipolaricaulota bacterium]